MPQETAPPTELPNTQPTEQTGLVCAPEDQSKSDHSGVSMLTRMGGGVILIILLAILLVFRLKSRRDSSKTQG